MRKSVNLKVDLRKSLPHKEKRHGEGQWNEKVQPIHEIPEEGREGGQCMVFLDRC